ncbi:hypothetical protein AB0876_31815 [Mycobacterium sp. NPDC049093]
MGGVQAEGKPADSAAATNSQDQVGFTPEGGFLNRVQRACYYCCPGADGDGAADMGVVEGTDVGFVVVEFWHCP